METRCKKRPRLQGNTEQTKDEWIGCVLSSNRVIVSRLMRFLSTKELSRVLSVCSLWRECASQEKQRRFEIHHFGFSLRRFDTGDADDDHAPFCVNTPSEIGNHFYQVFSGMSADPRVVFIFTTERITRRASKFFEQFHSRRTHYEYIPDQLILSRRHVYSTALCNHLSTLLPRRAEVFLSTSWGQIWHGGVHPLEMENCDGLTTLILPSVPGVEYSSFRLFQEDCRTPNELSGEALAEMSGLSNVRDIEALLLFTSKVPSEGSGAARLIEFTMRQNPQMAVGGALVRDFSVPIKNCPRKIVDVAGLAIHGQGVRAASILLDPTCRGRERVRERFASVAANFHPTPGRSVALVFACSGRGVYYHKETSVETSAFAEFFPGIPVVGLFGDGEFGYDSFTPPLTSSGLRIWQHSFTSIFVLLEFKTSIGRGNLARDGQERANSQ